MSQIPRPARRAMLCAAGLACGVSPAFSGYFDISLWGPIALALIIVALGLLVARPAVPSGLAAAAVVALLLFAAWSLVSMSWAESADRALTEGNRWILYATFLLVVLLLVEERGDALALIGGGLFGVIGVAAYDLVRMLADDGAPLFGGSRLLEPLGYVNGLGGYFLLGFWPLIAIAERPRHPAVAGAAAGIATLLASLTLLTDSRGTALAFAVSALILIALLPGRARRTSAVIAIALGLAVAWGPLASVTQPLHPGQGAPAAAVIRRAADWSLLAGVGVALGWGVGCWAIDAIKRRHSWFAARLPAASAAILGVIAIALVAIAAAAAGDPGKRLSEQYEAFTKLKPVSANNRFTSGGGNRYDYWRIAWAQFTSRPLEGVGAGNYDRTYFLERRTNEDVRQAHSIELQTLGETGIVGGLLLGSFLALVLAGLARRARAARARAAQSGLTVAAGGMFLVWLSQTSVDWLHLIPGVTGIALAAAAVLLRSPGSKPEPPTAALRRLRWSGLAVGIALAVGAAALIGRPTLAAALRSEAQAALGTRPVTALRLVDESLSLDPYSVQSYYTKAAALARLDAYAAARRALIEAIAREPHNYVTWALLGDLATRRGNLALAMHDYRRASALNPRNRGLMVLSKDRGLVERLHRHPNAAAMASEGEA